jgi:glycosyltransferase involved in cell wall biosynthesis
MNEDTVSVVIPLHNGTSFVAAAIQSVLAQTQPAHDIIVVDDASDDDVAGTLAPFGNQITLLRQERKGVSAARNYGIATATGAWIALLDHDDEWLPNKLERMLAAVAGKPEVALLFSDLELFGERSQASWLGSDPPPSGRVFRQLLLRNFICPSATMFRKAVAQELGGFDETLLCGGEDIDMWRRIAARWEALYVPEVLTRYRLHPGNYSKKSKEMLTNHYTVLVKAESYAPEDYAAMRPEVNHRLAEICFEIGRIYMHEKAGHEARGWFRRGLKYRAHLVRTLAYWAATYLPSGARGSMRQLKRALGSSQPFYHD